jgi:hypothetical protein
MPRPDLLPDNDGWYEVPGMGRVNPKLRTRRSLAEQQALWEQEGVRPEFRALRSLHESRLRRQQPRHMPLWETLMWLVVGVGLIVAGLWNY